MRLNRLVGVAFLLLGLPSTALRSQNVVHLTLDQAKSRLLRENLTLLAEQYSIAIAEAEAVQARVWNNPNFVWNSDLYSVEKNQYMNYKNQVLIQLEMMVPVTGRFHKAGRVADLNVDVAKATFSNTLRELIFSFTLEYNGLAVAQERSKLLQEVEALYDQLIKSAELNQKVGALAGSEVLRLQSERLTVEAERMQNAQYIEASEARLKTLLYLQPEIRIQAELTTGTVNALPPMGELMAQMAVGRGDYRAALSALEMHRKNISLQRALAIGDVKIGFQPHDRGSNYVRPYQGIVVEIPLPMFDRNQGNVSIAENEYRRAQVELVHKENEMQNELFSLYRQCLEVNRTLEEYSNERLAAVRLLNKSATENYLKRHLSLLEYIDLQRIYKQTITDYLTVKQNQLDAHAALMYAAGQNTQP
jgi:cobalt-zinc-cadmium efflux system outer membrane protein